MSSDSELSENVSENSDSEEEYVVEKILEVKFPVNKDKRKFLVKWQSYDDPTWEPAANIETNDEVLKEKLKQF